jgi:hypothetical protein
MTGDRRLCRLPRFAGLGRKERTKVGKRSGTGEDLAARTTLTRVATLRDLSRDERER